MWFFAEAGEHPVAVRTRSLSSDAPLAQSARLYGPIQNGDSASNLAHAWRADFDLAFRIDPNKREELAGQMLRSFCRKVYRRPLTNVEADELLRFYRMADHRGESFERCLQVAISSALVSPQFLFINHPESNTQQFELASRLSYLIWNSVPDERLLELAETQQLESQLDAEVHRMIDDPRSDAFLRSFSGQWLRTRQLQQVTPDTEQFPGFDDKLRDAMAGETEACFAYLIRDNRPVLELLDADYTFLNARLAEHYGISTVSGDQFQLVKLDNSFRGGVLTHASLLTVTSNPNRTSPVRRGQFVLEQILGTPPPPPPPDVGNLDETPAAMASASLRERIQLHRQNPTCAACHSRMDPIGFAFENFDAVGRWRATDGEFPIEPSGELSDGRSFENIDDLKRLLTEKPKQFGRTFVRNLLTYALGRGLDSGDFATVESIRRALADDDYRARTAIVAIVNSDVFRSNVLRSTESQ
jgi:hypothetical protein